MNPPPRRNDPSQYIGTPIVVKTTNGDTFRGEIFCFDINTSNAVILKEDNLDGTVNFRLIKLNAIRETTAEGSIPQNVNSYLPPCDRAVVAKREKRNLAAFEDKSHVLGVGVTQEAQELFDFIYKTHPECVWDGQKILVMGVTITPPYNPESCVGGERRLQERIEQVITMFRQRQERQKMKKNLRESQRNSGMPSNFNHHSSITSNVSSSSSICESLSVDGRKSTKK